jgi:hypothetical protein
VDAYSSIKENMEFYFNVVRTLNVFDNKWEEEWEFTGGSCVEIETEMLHLCLTHMFSIEWHYAGNFRGMFICYVGELQSMSE